MNLAKEIKQSGKNVALADLDIVNPYFRAKDSEAELKKLGIHLICSEYANTNLDIPALPDELYAITDQTDKYFVLDIGGDDRGAYVLGRIAPKITEERNFDCFAVVNMFRPLSKDAESSVTILNEIEYAGGINFTGVINNSNLGESTTKDDILSSFNYSKEIALKKHIPVAFTTVNKKLKKEFSELEVKEYNLKFMELQDKPFL